MFADLSGSSRMAETLDPEEMRDLINSCFDRMVPVVTEYGGTVNTFLGDGMLALFGAPTAHENDPERSLRAALRMQEVLAAFGAERGLSLQMHFGINTGLVVAGSVGSHGRNEYGVTGDAVNLASRLEDASATGEILVGPETYRLTSHLFEFEPAPPLRITGKSAPVAAFRLLGVRGNSDTPGRKYELAAGSPLVGRTHEIAAASERIEGLKAGKGGALAIIGDAGLGKSRAISELRRVVEGSGLSWIEVGAPPVGQSTSYSPFIEIIRDDAGIAPSDGEEERWRKLEKRVDELCPEEGRNLLPFIAALLKVEVPNELAVPSKYLDPESVGRQLFRMTRRFFSCLAETTPLVLVFEDIHWLDESSIQLLEHLLPVSREVPLLIVMTCRPEHGGPVERLRRAAAEHHRDWYSEIRLAPLSASETGHLIRNLIDADELPSGLRDVVLRKAGGNPLFVEEVVRAAVDLGGLKRDEATGRWKITDRIERLPIPDTLVGVIAARVDRLSEGAREVLKLASVIGRGFHLGVLGTIADSRLDVAAGLAELVSLELVSAAHGKPGPEYVFKHSLVQEATYEGVLLRQRQKLHRRVAEYIESAFAEHLDEYYGLVAYHYTKAELWSKAQEYLLKAGEQAGRIAADTEVLAHYQQALAAYTLALGEEWDPMQRAVLESNIGEALFRRGEHGQGRRHLERALEALGAPYPSSRHGVRRALVREVARQAAHRLFPTLLVRPPTADVDPKSKELSHQYETLQWMDFFQDGERCTLSTLLLLNQAESSGYVVGMVKASSGIGVGLDAMGLKRLGEFYCRRAARLADLTGEPWLMGDPYTLLGIHEDYTMGRSEEARRCFERGAKGYWESGSIKGWAAATTLAGRSMARRGHFQSALEIYRHVGQVAEDAAEHQAQGWALSFEGEVLVAMGRYDEASARLLRAIELLNEVPDHLLAAFAGGILGRCYLRSGRLLEARQTLEDVRRSVVDRRLRGFLVSPVWQSLAELDLAAADSASGGEIKALTERASRSAAAALAQGSRDVLALAPALRVTGSVDYLRGRTARAMQSWQRSIREAEARGMRYELSLSLVEVGERTGDPGSLHRGESLLADLGIRAGAS